MPVHNRAYPPLPPSLTPSTPLSSKLLAEQLCSLAALRQLSLEAPCDACVQECVVPPPTPPSPYPFNLSPDAQLKVTGGAAVQPGSAEAAEPRQRPHDHWRGPRPGPGIRDSTVVGLLGVRVCLWGVRWVTTG